MTVRVGINGFGRIGRSFWRAVQKNGADIDIVAVNDLGDKKTMAHLLKYDSVMGVLADTVTSTDNGIVINGKKLQVLSERDPAKLPWKPKPAAPRFLLLRSEVCRRPFSMGKRVSSFPSANAKKWPSKSSPRIGRGASKPLADPEPNG